MIGYFRSIKRFPLKLIPLAVCATILTAALSIYITIDESNRIESVSEDIAKDKTSVEWSVVSGIIEDNYAQAKRDAKVTALEVEYGLKKNYPNLQVLEEEFNNEEYTSKFNEVLKESIVNTNDIDKNSPTFVGTKNHLIAMFANNDSHILGGIDSDHVVNWSDIVKINPNPTLTNESIKRIIAKDNGILFSMNSQSESGFAETVTSPSLEALKQIYEKDGLDGLKNISLLAAAYITDSGDIFGTDDKTLLKSNDNHKLIIVRAVDLTDVINENKLEIENVMLTIDNLTAVTESQGERLILQSVLWSFILFLLSIFLIVIYNSEEKKGHLHGDRKGGK